MATFRFGVPPVTSHAGPWLAAGRPGIRGGYSEKPAEAARGVLFGPPGEAFGMLDHPMLSGTTPRGEPQGNLQFRQCNAKEFAARKASSIPAQTVRWGPWLLFTSSEKPLDPEVGPGVAGKSGLRKSGARVRPAGAIGRKRAPGGDL